MKKILIAISILFFFNYNASATEIAVIDVDQIVKESKAMQYLQKKVSQKQEEYQKEVTKRQNSLEKEQKSIEGKKSVLSEKAFKNEVEEFEKKVVKLRNFVDRRQNSLKKASLDAMSKINDEIKEIITDLSEEKGFDAIIPASGTLYFKNALDVSDEVLKRLNKKITRVKVRFN